ncbi:MAG: hypothetical protein ACR2JV_00290 [Gaiellales bacterium]
MEADAAGAQTGLRSFGHALWVAALVWAILFSVLAGLFASGYAMEDPGGLAGFGLVLAIFLPMLLVSLLAWKAPTVAYPILLVVTALAVVFGVWQLIDPITLRDVENQYGPISAIGSFITMVPVALVWRYRAWPAALMLLVIAVAGLLPEFRVGLHLGSSGAVALPMLLETALLGAAAAFAPRR